MRRGQRIGIVLITTMLSICIVVMMLNVFLQAGTLNLMRSSTFYDREVALQAAQSGLEYAVTRLQANNSWRGDGNMLEEGKEVVVSGSLADGFCVAESYGSVVGVVRNRDGVVSSFRIKFNYEDDSDDTWKKVPCSRFGTEDDKKIPSGKFAIQSPYVSVNNLEGSASVPMYRANANGQGIAKSASSLEGGTVASVVSHLPMQRVCVIVEGLSGKGLRDVAAKGSPEAVIEAANAIANSSTALTHRYVEAYYCSNVPVFCGDAATAQGDISVKLGYSGKMYVETLEAKDEGASDDLTVVPLSGSIRSCTGKVTVRNGHLNTFGGKVLASKITESTFTDDTNSYTFLDEHGVSKVYKFTTNKEPSRGAGETITWNEIAKADSSGDQLSAGFYQWHLAPNATVANPCYELRYYPGGYAVNGDGTLSPHEADNYKLAVVGSVVEGDPGVTREIGGATVTVQRISLGDASKVGFVTDTSGNVIEPTLNLRGQLYCPGDFVLCSKVDEVTGHCPKVLFNSYVVSDASGDIDSKQGSVLTAKGDIALYATVVGQGCMTTRDGDVTVVGRSVLEAGSSDVAIYANNVNLKSLSTVVDLPSVGIAPVAEQIDISGDVSHVEINSTDPCAAGGSSGERGSGAASPKITFNYGVMCDLADLFFEKNAKAAMESYLEKLGAYVEVTHLEREHETFFRPETIEIEFKFADESGHGTGTNYKIEYTHGWASGINCSIKCRGEWYDNLTVKIPDNSVASASTSISGSGTGCGDTVNICDPTTAKCAKLFKNLSYGDQCYGGIIYAKKCFNADLGDQCNLVVNGAIRAEGGDVCANCKDILLMYDESCLRFLLPDRSKVTRLMWTCW